MTNEKFWGRLITSPRLMGKCGFVHVFWDGRTFQIFVDAKNEGWELFKSLHQGDIVGFNGDWFETKSGENTVRVENLRLIQESTLPMPCKVGGVGLEISRKNPYMNLLAEAVSLDKEAPYRDTIILRSRLLKSIREFLDERGFLEVTTPTLISNPFGADAKPFQTEDYYLRIAPELELKKLIVGGFTKIYEIGKSFRNEGLSQRHNPEFTMLELYSVGGNYIDAMRMVDMLMAHVTWDLFKTRTVRGLNWDDGSILTYRVVPELMPDLDESQIEQPTFVTGFSAEDSPLAKSGEDGIAERFELYAGGMEIANGYSELNDPEVQLANFERQGVVDEDYINALKAGMPPTYGIGIGIDRLLMLFTGRNIKEVI